MLGDRTVWAPLPCLWFCLWLRKSTVCCSCGKTEFLYKVRRVELLLLRGLGVLVRQVSRVEHHVGSSTNRLPATAREREICTVQKIVVLAWTKSRRRGRAGCRPFLWSGGPCRESVILLCATCPSRRASSRRRAGAAANTRFTTALCPWVHSVMWYYNACCRVSKLHTWYAKKKPPPARVAVAAV